MTLALRKRVPGRADVNRAFSRWNIARLKQLYIEKKQSGQGYHFGDLSALFCGLSDEERKAWDHEIAAFYPPDVCNEITRTLEAAFFHKDQHGHEHPVPIRWDWIGPISASVSRGVRVTYDPTGPSYHIELIGYPSPAASTLDRRRTGGQGFAPEDDFED
jgi:hypothetical protein